MKIFQQNNKRAGLYIIVALYLLATAFYFSPIPLAHKICIPVTVLSVGAFLYSPLFLLLAMVFSAIGDYMGSLPNFVGQMGSFALAQLSFVVYFLRLREQNPSVVFQDTKRTKRTISSIVAAFFFVAILIMPKTPEGLLRMGIILYAAQLFTMVGFAMNMRSKFFQIGGPLFMISDGVLAYNKFVEHIPQAWLWILIPYFAAQLLLFLGAWSIQYNTQNH